MFNPTISRELQREHQSHMLREAEVDRLAREHAEPASSLDQRVMLPVADALVSLGQRIQRHYAGQSAGLVFTGDAHPAPSPEDWLAFLGRNVRPGGTFLLIHMGDHGVTGFTCWGSLAAAGSPGAFPGATEVRLIPPQR